MDTKNTTQATQEQISAFSDGENSGHTEIVLAALRQPEGRESWDIYHHIGDVLRSEDMAFEMSPDFASRMAARLDAEPTIIAPAVRRAQTRSEDLPAEAAGAAISGRPLRRFAMAGVAAAAVATVALLAMPGLMPSPNGPNTLAGVPPAMNNPANSLASNSSALVAVNVQDGVVLRDPRIDDYLLAHQRFSPSVYSTAQYARSAAFSNDSNK